MLGKELLLEVQGEISEGKKELAKSIIADRAAELDVAKETLIQAKKIVDELQAGFDKLLESSVDEILAEVPSDD